MCATRRQVGGGEGDVKKSRVTRKHVLIAAVSLVIMALVVVGVVESVRIFSKHNVEVLKVFSQSVSQSINQSITSFFQAIFILVLVLILKDYLSTKNYCIRLDRMNFTRYIFKKELYSSSQS